MSRASDERLTSIALCLTIQRSDGVGIGVTSHDEPITRENVRFEPSGGLMPGAVQDGDSASPSTDIRCALTSSGLRVEDLRDGHWDGAQVRLEAHQWVDSSAPPIELARSSLGEVEIEGDTFHVELDGEAKQLERSICPMISPDCRAILGDKACQVDMVGRQLRAKVIGVTGQRVQLDVAVGSEYQFGSLRFLDGPNCGLKCLIVSADAGAVTLRGAPSQKIENGSRVLLLQGCDKRLATCHTRFSNVVNFRGEPHVPGTDFLLRYPGV